ncbi:hypothetical protein [Citrobacter koseri]|uniref:hypothetical protein n=1 Tax=Citrobacter koseri TaxID=545 RepID=UPI0023B0C205|nr:hypothetical protein [Citrobacter koseri]
MSPATILIALVSDRQLALPVLLVLMSTPEISVLRSLFSNIPELIRPDKKEGLLRPVIVKKIKVINAGWQLCMCIHRYVLKIVNMNVLSALSFRGRQTYRSEIVKTVSGSLLPATVRPAPFYTALSVSLSQMEAAHV